MRSKTPKCWPYHLGTKRGFKVRKRSEIRATLSALDDLRLGCAFMPPDARELIVKAENAIKRVASLCSMKRWGR